MKKKKNNEPSIDELLGRPENHQVMEDGSILYGYNGVPETWKDYWFELKQDLGMLWSMKNPFDEHRPELIGWIELIRPDLYAIAFPFRFYGKILISLFSSETSKKYAIKQFKNSTLCALLEEMFAMSVFAAIAILIALGLKTMGLIE